MSVLLFHHFADFSFALGMCSITESLRKKSLCFHHSSNGFAISIEGLITSPSCMSSERKYWQFRFMRPGCALSRTVGVSSVWRAVRRRRLIFHSLEAFKRGPKRRCPLFPTLLASLEDALDDGVAHGFILFEGADGGVAALAELGAVHGEP